MCISQDTGLYLENNVFVSVKLNTRISAQSTLTVVRLTDKVITKLTN